MRRWELNPSRDELIEPLSLLWYWSLVTEALGGIQDASAILSIDATISIKDANR